MYFQFVGCAHSPLEMARNFPLHIVRFPFLHEVEPAVGPGGYPGIILFSPAAI